MEYFRTAQEQWFAWENLDPRFAKPSARVAQPNAAEPPPIDERNGKPAAAAEKKRMKQCEEVED
jgi:hypothetical protein